MALVTGAFGAGGGIAEYNRQLILALGSMDLIEQVIVLAREGGSTLPNLPDRVQQRRVTSGRLAYSAAVLRYVLKEPRIDVVFCGHLYMVPLAAAIADLLGIPLWVQVHGVEAWRGLSALHRRAIGSAALITSVSRYTRRRLIEWADIEPARVRVLPNTIDPRFCPGPKPAYLLERHKLYEKKVLMTVSRLEASEQYKGHDRVIRVLPQLLQHCPEAIYVIVGDGNDRPRLEELAAEMAVDDRVCFAGLVPSEELPDYFHVADSARDAKHRRGVRHSFSRGISIRLTRGWRQQGWQRRPTWRRCARDRSGPRKRYGAGGRHVVCTCPAKARRRWCTAVQARAFCRPRQGFTAVDDGRCRR